MTATATLEERVSQSYTGLSDKLRLAADYVVENPFEVATRSLRAVASTSGVSPATFSRLARALGYDDYEQMREEGRVAMGQQMVSFADRALALTQSSKPPDAGDILRGQSVACMTNIEALSHRISADRLDRAVEALHTARQVLLIGSLGSTGFVEYFAYLAQWFKGSWHVAGRNGTALAAAVAKLDRSDAMVAISKAPYARRTVSALRSAHEAGITTVLITDSHTSPALVFADHSFIVSTDSPQFFSSYAATLVLIETIVTLLLTKEGEGAEDLIRATEHQIHALGETWSE
ncbi:MAG: MurR/RpiR family transcriptional regulator [Pseudomonadota bacterium]